MTFMRPNWNKLFRRSAGMSGKPVHRNRSVPSNVVELAVGNESIEEISLTAPARNGTLELPHQNLVENSLSIEGYSEGFGYNVDYDTGTITNLRMTSGSQITVSYAHEDDGATGISVMRDGLELPSKDWLNLVGENINVVVRDEAIDVSIGAGSEKPGPTQYPELPAGVTLDAPVSYYVKGERCYLAGHGQATQNQVLFTFPLWAAPKQWTKLRTVEVSGGGEVTARVVGFEMDGESFRVGGYRGGALYPDISLYPSPSTYPSSKAGLNPSTELYPFKELYPYG